MSNQQRGLTISPDNPFKQDILRMQAKAKEGNRISKLQRITVIETIEYFPGRFTKIFQDRRIFNDLTMEACKILIHMAINMDYDQEKIQLLGPVVGLERRRFSRGILDLLTHRILVKEKPSWYWVNVTLIVVGAINKHDKEDL